LQGTFELIERDAAAIWWYNRIPRTQIDLEGLKIDVVQRCMQHFKSQGKVLRLLEITTDIEIPCYVALAYHPFERGSLQLGFGCHFSPRISISRATNELLQTDAAKVLKMQNLESEYSQYFEFENYNQTFLNPHNHSELRPEPEFSGTMNAALRQLLNILNRHSLDLHALDFSYPHHPIKVVRSMIPGLRSMMYELGPGRLFQVPVTMGHFPKPRNESEMNSYCLDI
jgi:ribosomal protein S12 methylthiotransferase accessory factor